MKRNIALAATCGAVLAGSVAWAAAQPDVAARADRVPEAEAAAAQPGRAFAPSGAQVTYVAASSGYGAAARPRPFDRLAATAAPMAGETTTGVPSPAASTVQPAEAMDGSAPEIGMTQVVLVATGVLAAVALFAGGDSSESD